MRRRGRAFVVLAAGLALAPAVRAVKPGPDAVRDKSRFGFDHPFPQMRKGHAPAAAAAFAAFNAAQGKRWKLRFSPRTGAPESLIGGADTPRYGPPDSVAKSFLNAHQDMLGLDPTTLTIERQSQGAGHQHVLFRQSYKGLPVEFAAVKVHMDLHGAVLGVHSSYEPNLNLPTVPLVTAAAASATALADAGAGGKVTIKPTLVVMGSETDGLAHLAWKIGVGAGIGAAWRYYVDALTGKILLRYNNHQFLAINNVSGMVYDLDPSSTPVQKQRPFANQYVYIGAGAGVSETFAPTGNYAWIGTTPVSMSLQGPFVNISEFRGPSAHYDNGGCNPAGTCTTQGGLWTTCATSASSPHPYDFGFVYSSTISVAGCSPGLASFAPVFADFQVGVFNGASAVSGEGGDLVQDDELVLYDGNSNPVGSYVGNRGSFTGAEVHGTSMNLALIAKGGGNIGYDVGSSSALYFVNPFAVGSLPASHVWTANDTSQPTFPGITCPLGGPCPNLHGEISLFYHLNLMHDFFNNGSLGQNTSVMSPGTEGQAFYSPGVNSCAACSGGVYAKIPSAGTTNLPALNALAHAGPDMFNAFFDPDFNNIFFGDVNGSAPTDAFIDDATVPHHEYVHYVVNKIWPLVNFGQAGTISEAYADYFSGSSLNMPGIGSYVNNAFEGLAYPTPLRGLDSAIFPPVYTLGNPTPGWTGEIHADSPFVSQSLWDIRKKDGQQCADNLAFQALLYYPESFQELYDAVHQVAASGAIASCPGTAAADVNAAFGTHLPEVLAPTGQDAYEPNDAFDTAVDISTLGVITATIYPTSDQDFYTFGAGPGLVTIKLNLPPALYAPSVYSAYQLKLFDNTHALVASAAPPYNGAGTIDGFCQNGNNIFDGCTTTQAQVVLSYNNPSASQLYVEVVGGDSLLGNSPSDVFNTTPYTLSASFNAVDALSAGIIVASFSNDVISYTVNVTTHVSTQLYTFRYAQLRDQSQTPMSNTNTSLGGSFLAAGPATNALGQISGTVQLVPGFTSRFPSAGTVFLEIFASTGNVVTGPGTAGDYVYSLGLSNAIDLTGNGTSSVTAYNNAFNPLKGEKATIKYMVAGSGRLTLKIYTVTGEPVTTLFDGTVSPGMGSIDWYGRNGRGSTVASGIYILRAEGPGIQGTQKIAVIK